MPEFSQRRYRDLAFATAICNTTKFAQIEETFSVHED